MLALVLFLSLSLSLSWFGCSSVLQIQTFDLQLDCLVKDLFLYSLENRMGNIKIHKKKSLKIELYNFFFTENYNLHNIHSHSECVRINHSFSVTANFFYTFQFGMGFFFLLLYSLQSIRSNEFNSFLLSSHNTYTHHILTQNLPFRLNQTEQIFFFGGGGLSFTHYVFTQKSN